MTLNRYNGLASLSNSTVFVPSPTVSSLAELTAYVDNLFSSGNGYRFGYLVSSSSVAAGLPTGGHYLIMISNSDKYRVIFAIYSNGGRINAIAKTSGTWASEWKYITLS